MFMRMIYDDSLAQAAYLIGCQQTGEAIVIDPERDIDRYIGIAEKEGLTIIAAAETHIHADFLSGVREFSERTTASAILSDEGDANWKYEWVYETGFTGKPYSFQLVKDGDEFMIGNIRLTVLHTPGHTPEHICFKVWDRGGGASEAMGIVTGDFVFVGDVGRPDLLESAAGMVGAMEPSARRLGASLRDFATLPDYLQVWPGHGAGSACGKALGAVPQSTVGYEKRFNAAVRSAQDPDSFVAEILRAQPEPPSYFARMKRENKRGPRLLGVIPRPKPIVISEIPSEAVVVDTRPWEDFRNGRLPGSLSILPSKSFSMIAGAYIDPEQRIVLVVDESDLDSCVRMLIRIGLDEIVGWLAPSELAGAAGLKATREIDVDQATQERGVTILDVRNASEFDEGHIEGAVNVAYLQLADRISEVPKGKPLLVHCRSGFRSARASSYLNKHGFEATNLAGGFLAWQAAGKPGVRG